jgi:hypothetical protein
VTSKTVKVKQGIVAAACAIGSAATAVFVAQTWGGRLFAFIVLFGLSFCSTSAWMLRSRLRR